MGDTNYDVAKLLIENGANLDYFISNYKGKIFLNFTKNRKIRNLLNKFIKDIYKNIKTILTNIKNNSDTPLMYAIMNHNLNVVQFLVEHGADINLATTKDNRHSKLPAYTTPQ